MESFGDWIRSIVVLIVFAVFAELLIPRSSMQNFIRVVIGLLIMATILSPATVWLYGFKPMESAAIRSSEELREMNGGAFWQAIYAQGFAQKIEAYLREKGYRECRVRVTTASDRELRVEEVLIFCQEVEAERIKAAVCERFELASDRVKTR